MREIETQKTQFTVSDFLSWSRQKALDLNPPFQRRSVWKPDARSYFIDTVVRGLPAPIIYLRQKLDLNSLETIREVVDGQQRLRTLFAFIDPRALPDFDKDRDAFVVKRVHNDSIHGKPFGDLSKHFQERILNYQFSTHVLPTGIEDREVLEIFARLNATGTKLNPQELRNAEYFGELKSFAYDLALEQLQRWRDWGIFTDDQIARMNEVELTSDLLLNIVRGLKGKTQKALNDFYAEFDEDLPRKEEIRQRFRRVMDEIDSILGGEIIDTVFASEVYFFTLFLYLYDEMYGLGSDLKRTKPNKLPALDVKLKRVSERFASKQVPPDVLDSIVRASADLGRRRTRLQYMKKICHASTGQ